MVSNIHQVRRVAWLLRDRISVDAWLILNQLDQQFSTQPPSDEFRVTAAQDRLNHAIITLSAFGGLVMESMTRGDGWRFLDIGRRLERAIQMVELLRNGLPKEAFGGVGVLEAILEMADSSITYRSRYLTSVQVDLVLDLLLVDEANPRSIAFQLARLREHIGELPGSKTSIRRPAEERMAIVAAEYRAAHRCARTGAFRRPRGGRGPRRSAWQVDRRPERCSPRRLPAPTSATRRNRAVYKST